MNTRNMARKFLMDSGYDGLVQFDGECSCKISDLVPCSGEDFYKCEAGYKVDCNCDMNCDFHITTTKPKEG